MNATTVLSIAGIVLGSQWLGTLINKAYDQHINKKTNPIEKLEKRLDAMHADMQNLNKTLESNSELTMSHARDRLDSLCNKYLEMGYIPEKSFVSFKLLGEAYISAEGNHGFDTLFKHVIETLPTKK